MKRTFRLLGLSALVLGLAVACNNNQPVEAVVDSIDSVIDAEPIEDVTIDSALVAEQEPEAPVVDNKKKATTTKKNNANVTVNANAGKAEATSAVNVTTNEPVKAVEANTTVTKESNLDKKAEKASKKLKR